MTEAFTNIQPNEPIDPPPQVGAPIIKLDDERLSRGGNGAPAINDDELIIAGETAAELYHRSREQIEPMARGLAAAKRKYPATREFGAWLKGSPYSKIGDQDRAALIKIGEQLDRHDGVVVEFLRATDLISPQTIWAGIDKKLRPQLRIDPSCYDSKSGNGSEDANRSTNGATTDAHSSADHKRIEPEADAKPHDFRGTGARFDLVVLTPSKDDLARLRDANLDGLSECLPVRKHLGDAAAVVIAAKITDLPVVIERLLPLCGFNRPKRVLPLGQPTPPDIIDARVLVIVEKGDIKFIAPKVWLDGAADPIDVAEGLYEASSTLHLFATAKAKKTERRCVIVGNDGWKKLPVV